LLWIAISLSMKLKFPYKFRLEGQQNLKLLQTHLHRNGQIQSHCNGKFLGNPFPNHNGRLEAFCTLDSFYTGTDAEGINYPTSDSNIPNVSQRYNSSSSLIQLYLVKAHFVNSTLRGRLAEDKGKFPVTRRLSLTRKGLCRGIEADSYRTVVCFWTFEPQGK